MQGGRVVFANSAIARALGKTPEEICSYTPKQLCEHVHPYDRDTLVIDAQGVIGDTFQLPRRGELRMRDGQDEWRWFEVFTNRIHFDGRPALLSALVDIQARKNVEAELRQSNERYRALVRRSAHVEERERQRIAHDIHDQAGPLLATFGINLNVARSLLPGPPAAPGLAERLDECILQAETLGRRIRGIMAELRPPLLDDYGLLAALRWYGDEILRWHELTVVVEGNEPNPALGKDEATQLFRVVQEALSNVVRHAEATQARISLADDGDGFVLQISDNGKGFDTLRPRQTAPESGWGLLTMEERVRSLGGTLAIESRLNRGTRLTIRVDRNLQERVEE